MIVSPASTNLPPATHVINRGWGRSREYYLQVAILQVLRGRVIERIVPAVRIKKYMYWSQRKWRENLLKWERIFILRLTPQLNINRFNVSGKILIEIKTTNICDIHVVSELIPLYRYSNYICRNIWCREDNFKYGIPHRWVFLFPPWFLTAWTAICPVTNKSLWDSRKSRVSPFEGMEIAQQSSTCARNDLVGQEVLSHQ